VRIVPNYLALRKRNSALAFRKPKAARWVRVKYWEIIADNLSKSEWTWGCVLAVDSSGRTIFVAAAHRRDGQRFIVRADEADDNSRTFSTPANTGGGYTRNVIDGMLTE